MNILGAARLALIAALTWIPLLGHAQSAASFPSKPVRILLPYAAGGTNDLALRIIASDLEARWKQPVLIEARPGAAGRIAYEATARAAPDGYTLANAVSSLTSLPALYKDLTFSPERDLVGVTVFLKYAPHIGISAALPATNIAEFVAYARANPGKLNYATQGRGNSQHVTFEVFNAAFGTRIQPVFYQGTQQVVDATIRNDVQLFTITDAQLPQVGDKVRLIATTNDTRLPDRPNLPTLKESGPFQFVPVVWIGLVAPGGTPRDIVEKIATDVAAVVRNPEIAAKILKTTGATATVQMPPAEFAQLLRSEYQTYGEWIKRLGIEAQ
jgi:tripartite-type tricarboxylate transporter receptor subunit TctC